MPKIQANGALFHYIALGEGPDVVMLHGFLGNLAVWHLSMVPQLRREFRVTTYDLRGHGYSEVTPTGYSAGEMAQDLLCLLDQLGIQKAVLVGHSFGADIALYFALKHPERVSKLIAMEPGLAECGNVVLVPHIASASTDTRDRMAIMAAANALAHLAGECAPNIVNPEVYESPAYRERLARRP